MFIHNFSVWTIAPNAERLWTKTGIAVLATAVFARIVVFATRAAVALAMKKNKGHHKDRLYHVPDMDIFGIYQKLGRLYGPQGWWPIKINDEQIKFKRARSESGLVYGVPYKNLREYKNDFRDPFFEIAVGALLTQSAAWKNVARAINNLFRAKTLTAEKIYKMRDSRLQELIRPAGYYTQKTKKLKIFVKWLLDNYAGDMEKIKKEKTNIIRQKLLSLWGIGPETADSIILYALNKPIFVVDEYTRRLCNVFGKNFKTYEEYAKLFEDNLSKNSQLYREYHALIVASGKDKHRQICLEI